MNELEVVTVEATGETVGEAKWAKSIDGPRTLAELTPKASRLPGAAPDLRYILCARQSVRQPPQGVLVCTAAEIFNA